MEGCQKLELFDVFRFNNPTLKKFSYHRMSTGYSSRIDFYLVSKDLCNSAAESFFLPLGSSDHQAIALIMHPHKSGKTYWKMNTKLLCNRKYRQCIEKLINTRFGAYSNIKVDWEIFKEEVAKISICFSKAIAQNSREHERQLLKQPQSAEENILTYGPLQCFINGRKNGLLQLEYFYNQKAEGAAIRSKAKYLMEGEKCTRYFFNLEKTKSASRKVSAIQDPLTNNIIRDPIVITKLFETHYSNIFQAKNDYNKCLEYDSFMAGSQLSEHQRTAMSCDITDSEILNTIKKFKNYKSPGLDGIPIEFYKSFSELQPPYYRSLLGRY